MDPDNEIKLATNKPKKSRIDCSVNCALNYLFLGVWGNTVCKKETNTGDRT